MNDPLPPPFDSYVGPEPYLFAVFAPGDAAIVHRELAYLHQRGYRIWYNEGGYTGSIGSQHIARALAKSSFCIIFISPNALQSYDVRNQVCFAMARQKDMVAIHIAETSLSEGFELQMASVQSVLRFRMSEDACRSRLQRIIPATVLDATAKAEKPEGNRAHRCAAA